MDPQSNMAQAIFYFIAIVLFTGALYLYRSRRYRTKKRTRMQVDTGSNLDADFIGLGRAVNPLARLMRSVSRDLHLTPQQWEDLLARYVQTYGPEYDFRGKQTMRGNLNKELRLPIISWKVFEKFIRFLQPRSVRLTITFRWDDGRSTDHFVDFTPDTLVSGEE